MKKCFCFLLTLLAGCIPAVAQDITGDWYGTLDFGMQRLALVFHIDRDGEAFTTVMDSPDQHAEGLATTATTFDGTTLKVSAAALGMTYEGRLAADSLQGTFRQGGLAMPLTFTRRQPERRRPQLPQPPFPYTSEEVTFPNASAGIALAGTLTVPEGEGPFPAAVLITGSGAQNRDEELFGHKPFFVLADYLTRHGIAVLRYDDRGTASSEGDYAAASIQDFASDAASALAWLRTRPEIDASAAGFIGHSEGGIIAYMLAAGDNGAAFIVSMAGPAVAGSEFMRVQRRLIAERTGLPEAAFRQNEQLVESMTEITDRYSYDYIESHLDSLAATMLPDFVRDDPQAAEQIKAGLLQSASPEMVSLLRYDPADDLARIACPVLALVGTRDVQVPPSVVEAPLRERINPAAELTVHVYPELNHLFQHAETGLPTEYAVIEETIAPEVLADIAAWIKKVTGRP